MVVIGKSIDDEDNDFDEFWYYLNLANSAIKLTNDLLDESWMD